MNYIIGFIGAGRVGFSLGKYFSKAGLEICGYYSKNPASSLEAAEFTASTSFEDLAELVINCNLLFITTPDDNIKEIWLTIQKFDLKNKIICHTSGSFSSTIFSDINTSGAFGYSIHPMFPFPDKLNTYKTLNKAYFSLEGDSCYFQELKILLEDLGNKVIPLKAHEKALYHLANVTVSNLVLSLLDIGTGYLEQCNVSKQEAINALCPLIEANVLNIKTKGFLAALTGPIERGDIETIKKHLRVLPNNDYYIYKRLSLNLVKLAERKNKKRNYENLKKKLEEDTYEK
ncbi:MAG: DUF2520 domain-containing protein [Clostridiaceae bacterium]|nr:DUF2520 domain-containing protein [Clostridiaceae bacterium]